MILPPNVTNARIINGTGCNGFCLAKVQLEYECVDESLQMEGNRTDNMSLQGILVERHLDATLFHPTNPSVICTSHINHTFLSVDDIVLCLLGIKKGKVHTTCH